MREKRGVPLGTSGVHADLELPAVVLTAVQRVDRVLGVALVEVPASQDRIYNQHYHREETLISISGVKSGTSEEEKSGFR